MILITHRDDDAFDMKKRGLTAPFLALIEVLILLLCHASHHGLGATAKDVLDLAGLDLLEPHLEALINVIALGFVAHQDSHPVGVVIHPGGFNGAQQIRHIGAIFAFDNGRTGCPVAIFTVGACFVFVDRARGFAAVPLAFHNAKDIDTCTTACGALLAIVGIIPVRADVVVSGACAITS